MKGCRGSMHVMREEEEIIKALKRAKQAKGTKAERKKRYRGSVEEPGSKQSEYLGKWCPGAEMTSVWMDGCRC